MHKQIANPRANMLATVRKIKTTMSMVKGSGGSDVVDNGSDVVDNGSDVVDNGSDDVKLDIAPKVARGMKSSLDLSFFLIDDEQSSSIVGKIVGRSHIKLL